MVRQLMTLGSKRSVCKGAACRRALNRGCVKVLELAVLTGMLSWMRHRSNVIHQMPQAIANAAASTAVSRAGLNNIASSLRLMVHVMSHTAITVKNCFRPALDLAASAYVSAWTASLNRPRSLRGNRLRSTTT